MIKRFVFGVSLLLCLACLDTGFTQERPREARQRERAVRPTNADVKYGPHRRNVLDFWQAESDEPTPLLVSIHGGGFRGGNKSVAPDLLRQCLDAKISVAAITYRLSDEAIAPAQFHDAARAIQFLRSQSKEWNIDPERVAATGGSAGAGLSLWLGFHDDLADTDNEDAVLRQSSRLSCMVVNNGQTSYDPRFIRELFPGTDTYKHPALAQLYDVDLDKLDDLPADKYKLFEYVSAINHLTKDDAPAMLIYNRPLDAKVTNQGIGIHHAKFGAVLKEKMDTLGIRCEVVAASERLGGGEPTSTIDFLKQHLLRDDRGARLKKVEGTITLDGKPLDGATITLIAKDGTVAKGVTDAEGKYKLHTVIGEKQLEGAPLGVSKVSISKTEGDTGDKEPLKKDVVPPKFAEPARSAIVVEVSEGENRFDFDLRSE